VKPTLSVIGCWVAERLDQEISNTDLAALPPLIAVIASS
jgi:hypothetical protein